MNELDRLETPETPAIPPERERVFVTGATGYIGGRLVPRLLAAGYRVRCLARSPRKLAGRPWAADPRVEIVAGDMADRGNRGDDAVKSLAERIRGCGPAFYLVHSMMTAGTDYARSDLEMAARFADAAGRAGLSRILYLGGLGEMADDLSEHLRSRREVEAALASGPTPLTVFRAAMVIGSGSASFEILRYLVERLPVMITPKWVSTECQPIAIRDVLHYLVSALATPETVGRTLDIGGPDVVSYQRLMKIMAEERRLPHRLVIPVPVFTPRLSSFWIHLVTPLSHRIARPLADGLRNRVVCRNDEAARLMPSDLLGVREAIARALKRSEQPPVETVWSNSGVIPGDPDWAGGTVFTDSRSAEIAAPPEAVFRAVCRIGGGNGWYAADWLWRLRGWMDRLVGGPGLRRGRRDPESLSYGDALDFWRVTGLEGNRRLTLRAEMKLPGDALLEFTLEPLPRREDGAPTTRLVQTARFRPKGLLGLAYWYAVKPFHRVVFSGMLDGICRTALEAAAASGEPTSNAGPESRAT
ncbi:MAG: SDR family oxidoreductase [Acidobacteriota bacterium]|nr:SDR family oxidoreductase [Acidobacteriota bacterium]